MALNQIIGTNIDDELLGLFDDDEIFGFDGNDTLDGFVGDDFLYGGFGRDALFGGADNDELYGDDGNDWLDGGDGIDIMWGGLGNDTYIVDNAGDVVIELDYWYFAPPGLTVHEWSAGGIDTVKSSISFTLPNVGFYGEIENLTLTGSADIDGSGNALGNVIRGNSGANVLSGGGGNDIYYIGAGDSVVETANQGIDTVYASVSYAMTNHIENVTLTGSSSINATGNGLNNRIIGNAGNNSLNGLGGVDRMEGRQGNDTYVVDNILDTVLEDAGSSSGTDTVVATVTYTLAANVENLTLSGTSAVNGTGNGLNNIIRGNAAGNVLNAGSGRDDLIGGGGSDILTGGAGGEADRFIFSLPTDGGTKGDTIKDFERNVDRIAFDHAGFGLAGTGSLASQGVDFVVGNAATASRPAVIFKPFADELWWDADGTGAGASQLLATVSLPINVNLAAGDFLVI